MKILQVERVVPALIDVAEKVLSRSTLELHHNHDARAHNDSIYPRAKPRNVKFEE